MKVHAVGTELYHANGRTDKTKLTADFRNFVNAPKNCKEVGATATVAGGCAGCAAGKIINLQLIERQEF
jgi:hypothetical protein